MASISVGRLACSAAILALAASLAPVHAQQQPGWNPMTSQGQPKGAAGAARGQPSPGATQKGEGAGPSGAGDESLRQRVEQLEGQLIDLQVVVGTLESLAKPGGGGGGTAGFVPRSGMGSGQASSDSDRLDAMETQIRALTGQLEQLAEQVRALNGQPRRSEAEGFREPVETGSRVGQSRFAPNDPAADVDARGGVSRFGSTTITADRADRIEGPMTGRPGPGPAEAVPPPPQAPAAVAAAPAGDTGNPKQLYETAYGYLLQQDYAAAEAAFDEFLRRYPNDSLAGNAQYWLGEAHFVRGEYKAAASAFLRGYTTYAKSPKAPDSLLKLAMSLDRLGQKEAACSSYGELITRFPNAPAHLKSRADSERRRVGCP